MSLTSRNPLRMAGANVNSGNVNTGEVNMTRGGGQVISKSGMYSGNPDGGIALLSGVAGRLNSVTVHPTPGNPWAQSGIPIFFFDAGPVPTSGGPFPSSNHKAICILNGPTGHSGQPTVTAAQGAIAVDMPFQSGLWARAASGAPGFSVSITPETNPPTG